MPPKKNSQAVVVLPSTLEVQAPEFVKVEKNLNTLGFFSPAKSRAKIQPTEKVVHLKREIDGHMVEAQARILPSAKYGLPTTADLDKYLAFQKIVETLYRRDGRVANPVGFSSTLMLSVLGIKDAGNNYQDIYDWLQRMTLTGINSKGVIYLARRKAWVSDTFHVFDRVVAVGAQLPDGRVADRNYVWLSEWQLDNINSNYLLPIDFDTYRKLRNHIAKVLVPLLQLWLYASRTEGRFEKKYGDLCEILNITNHKPVSLIRRQLEPSLKELQDHGYLADYTIELTADGRDYKMVASHGHKFYRDQKMRAALPASAAPLPRSSEEPSLVEALTTRGVAETQARRVLRSLPLHRPVLDQLEYGDYLIGRSKGGIANPAGFYLYVLRENIQPPASFETSTQRQIKGDSTDASERAQTLRLEHEYDQYCSARVASHVREMSAGAYDTLVTENVQQLKQQWSRLPQQTLREMAESRIGRNLRESLQLPTFEEFVRRGPQASLFD